MDYYVEQTNTSGFVNWANIAPFEPDRRERQRAVSTSDQPIHIAGAPDCFGSVSGPAAPTTRLSRNSTTSTYTPAPSDVKDAKMAQPVALRVNDANEIDRVAKQRVRLMAAQYASGTESFEMVA